MHAAGKEGHQRFGTRCVRWCIGAGLAARERIVLEQQAAVAKARRERRVVDARQGVAQRVQAFAVDASEVTQHDRVGRVMPGEACDEAKVVAPRRRAVLVDRRERPAVRPEHVFDREVAALAERGKRVVLHREQLPRTARQRFLDQLFLAAEVVIEQRDVRLGARCDRSMCQRLEAVLGDQPFDGIEQAAACIVPAAALAARGCVRSDGADCMFQGHGAVPARGSSWKTSRPS